MLAAVMALGYNLGVYTIIKWPLANTRDRVGSALPFENRSPGTPLGDMCTTSEKLVSSRRQENTCHKLKQRSARQSQIANC